MALLPLAKTDQNVLVTKGKMLCMTVSSFVNKISFLQDQSQTRVAYQERNRKERALFANLFTYANLKYTLLLCQRYLLAVLLIKSKKHFLSLFNDFSLSCAHLHFALLYRGGVLPPAKCDALQKYIFAPHFASKMYVMQKCIFAKQSKHAKIGRDNEFLQS